MSYHPREMTANESPPPFLSRVQLKNYRSIEACDVQLGPLAFFVGPNGSGKSNFLDALRLISDALTTSLDHALRERGGITEVRRRSSGHPTHFGLRIDFQLEAGSTGHLAFEIAARQRGDYVVKHEVCRVGPALYEVKEGKVIRTTVPVPPPSMNDRLYLVNAAGLPEFRPAYDALAAMGFYSFNPSVIRELQSPDRGDVLARDGHNLASVLERLERVESRFVLDRVREYLSRVVPGVTGFHSLRVPPKETVEFFQQVEGAKDAWKFQAINMSDGTLRALAILVALFQDGGERRIRLIGIEEPETALHPAAAGLLRDCIVEASASTQVLVTSHSADLLDDAEVSTESIFAVESSLGKTSIAALAEPTRSLLRDRLFTAGELLRANQLQPDPAQVTRADQLKLFRDTP